MDESLCSGNAVQLGEGDEEVLRFIVAVVAATTVRPSPMAPFPPRRICERSARLHPGRVESRDPEHERLTCAVGSAVALVCQVRQKVKGAWTTTGTEHRWLVFKGHDVTALWTCPSFFPGLGVWTMFIESVAVQWCYWRVEWRPNHSEVDEQLVIVDWGGQKVMSPVAGLPVRLSAGSGTFAPARDVKPGNLSFDLHRIAIPGGFRIGDLGLCVLSDLEVDTSCPVSRLLRVATIVTNPQRRSAARRSVESTQTRIRWFEVGSTNTSSVGLKRASGRSAHRRPGRRHVLDVRPPVTDSETSR